jgi:hypothetical protein
MIKAQSGKGTEAQRKKKYYFVPLYLYAFVPQAIGFSR